MLLFFIFAGMRVSVPQFIYTKVPQGQSPSNKSGFHMVYYSAELQDKKLLLEIESCIHYPGPGYFERKRVVLYKKIKNKLHQILIYLHALPEERDEFGRTGIFLAHGFILPCKLSEILPDVFSAEPYLLNHILKRPSDLTNLTVTESESGFIEPLTIEINEPISELQSEFELHEAERKLALALIKIAGNAFESASIVLKGGTEQVEETLERCYRSLPFNMKEHLGFDPAFDGGKIFFFPLKVTGFSKNLPSTGNPLIFDCSSLTFARHEHQIDYLKSETLFECWILSTPQVKAGEAERMYALTRFLEQKSDFLPENYQLSENFIQENENLIIEIFIKNLKGKLSDEWQKYPPQSAEEVLPVLFERFSHVRLAEWIEKTILREKILSAELPIWVENQQLPVLSIILNTWKYDRLTVSELNLPSEECVKLFNYFNRKEFWSKEWLYEVFFQFEDCEELLYEPYEKGENPELLKWLKTKLSEYPDIAVILAKELIAERTVGCFIKTGLPQIPELLENRLKYSRNEKDDVKFIYKYLKKNPQFTHGNFVFLKTLIKPELIFETVKYLSENELSTLRDTVIEAHPGIDSDILMKAGFGKEEIKSAKDKFRTSPVEIIKKWFGKK